MEMTGVVVAILPEHSGTSQRGEWKSQSFVIETQEQYPKHICFEVFGADRIAQFNIKCGEIITVQFDINARQYQDRWFNTIKAWNIASPGQQAPMQGGYNMNPQTGAQAAMACAPNPMNPNNPFPPAQQPGAPAGKSDDLPF
nr:MAG TPA: protein of unknown function (DUF3127) [Caudoviricetes sp.]